MKCSVEDCEEEVVYWGKGNRFCRKHAVKKGLIRDDLMMVITKPTKKCPLGQIQLIRVGEEQ